MPVLASRVFRPYEQLLLVKTPQGRLTEKGSHVTHDAANFNATYFQSPEGWVSLVADRWIEEGEEIVANQSTGGDYTQPRAVDTRGTDTRNFVVQRSPIDGLGVFARKTFEENEPLFRAIELDGAVTALGSKVNHCNYPNSFLTLVQHDGWWLLAKKKIYKGQEVTTDYRDTPPFIRGPDESWRAC